MTISFNNRFFLGGGGDEKQSAPLDALFSEAVGRRKPLIYFPLALNPSRFDAAEQWFRETFNKFNVFDVVVVKGALEKLIDYEEIGGIYIGGGNTQRLQETMQRFSYDTYVRNAARAGVPIYGGSAGAIWLGRDIRTAPEAEGAKGSHRLGLNLLDDFSIACHVEDNRRQTVEKLIKLVGEPVIALPEASGVVVEQLLMTVCGADSVIEARDGRIQERRSGARWKVGAKG